MWSAVYLFFQRQTLPHARDNLVCGGASQQAAEVLSLLGFKIMPGAVPLDYGVWCDILSPLMGAPSDTAQSADSLIEDSFDDLVVQRQLYVPVPRQLLLPVGAGVNVHRGDLAKGSGDGARVARRQ
jgi:hypothetical protein